jgi:lipoate-protein ligase A
VWRLVVGADHQSDVAEARCGAFNMAVDQALFESVQRGAAPVLRFYRWQPACLSLGRNQPARAWRSQLEAGAPDVVRRPTGGLAVLHDQELTYSVAVSVGVLGSPRATYQALNRALVQALTALGVPAHTFRQDNTREHFPRSGSCFATSALGEVGVAGRKLIGSAQRCERRALLQHGSILLDGDQSAASTWLGVAAGPAGTTSLRHELPYLPEEPALLRAFRRGFECELGIAFAPASLTPVELARARELTDFYCRPDWTWRV